MRKIKKAAIAASLAGLMLATATPADASVWNRHQSWRWHPCHEETYVGSPWGYGYNVIETDLVCSWGGGNSYVLKIVMPDGTVLIDNTKIFFPNGYTPSHKK